MTSLNSSYAIWSRTALAAGICLWGEGCKAKPVLLGMCFHHANAQVRRMGIESLRAIATQALGNKTF